MSILSNMSDSKLEELLDSINNEINKRKVDDLEKTLITK